MQAVNLAEAKARLSELMARALAGEDVQIARRGRPEIRLVPIGRAEVRQPIDWEAIDAFRESLPKEPSMTVEEMRRLDIL